MGNSGSNFADGLSFCGTIGDYPDFDAESDAKKLYKAFHSKSGQFLYESFQTFFQLLISCLLPTYLETLLRKDWDQGGSYY